jgi:phenylpyruvate tautomerase PptA (4-oxalocrotonate tautomerase family)
MPLVRIALRKGKSAEYQAAIGNAVHRAMMDTINVPALDRFQIITEHEPGQLIYDPAYLDIHRTDDVVFIQITISEGRSIDLRRSLFARIAELLHESPGIRKQDVLINLIEVAKENWSFGNGEAQYAKP